MGSMQQQLYHESYNVVGSMYYHNDHQLQQQQQHYMQQQHFQQLQQQNELERIKMVQRQASHQQQRALLHQQMMYYEQQKQQQQQQQQQQHQQQQQQHHHQHQQNYHHGDDETFDIFSIPSSQETPSSPSSMMGDKAQRRAEHNAIERARRESLNTKFQQLAHSLPNLHNDRRPSKGTIIERTLEYVKLTVEKEEGLKTEIEQLRLANESLISRMTNQVIEEEDEEDEDSTPECEDNFSSRSSVTSNSSLYYSQPDFNHEFGKFQQGQHDSSVLLSNKDTLYF